MYHEGYTDQEIANSLGRTKFSVKGHRISLGLKRVSLYSEEEIKILKEYASIMSLTEIIDKFNLDRSVGALSEECKKLGIKTKFSLNRENKIIE